MNTLSRPSTILTRTSRLRINPERAALAILRSLSPRRRLGVHEAEYVGEIQAYRLLDLAGVWEQPVPTALIAELPRVEVRLDADLPVSGSTHWLNGRWRITVNASEPSQRQRFTLAHELKHVIDHRHRDLLYQPNPVLTAEAQGEHAADHFAACLLMPRRWVKRAWGDGYQKVSVLSKLFDVSPQAMQVRLSHLGLIDSAGHGHQRQDELSTPAYRRLDTRSAGGPAR